jgi:hypothetical protein
MAIPQLFSALKQNLGDDKFEDDREVERVVTWWLVTQDKDFCQEGKQDNKYPNCGWNHADKQ